MRLPAALTRLTPRDKGFWRRLTKWERARLVQLQTSRSGNYGGGGYLPDDCSECGACGQPMLGVGMCSACYHEYKALMAKGSGNTTPPAVGADGAVMDSGHLT